MKSYIAFVAGGVLAGGLVYFATRSPKPAETVEPAPPPVVQLEQETLPAPVETLAEPAEPVRVQPPAPAPKKPAKPFRAYAASTPPVLKAELPLPPPVEVQPETPRPPVVPVAEIAPPPPPEPNRVTIAAGTLFTVRLEEDLSSEQSLSGDRFAATLDQPLVVDGFVIAERGSKVEGRVVESERAKKVKGTALLSLQLTRFDSSDGQEVDIVTDSFAKEPSRERVKDAAKVGAAASIGAIIGAIAGGGKGAAIGAAAGGAAGAGGVMATRGAPAELPVETRISFRLSEPVTITEQIR